MPPTDPGGPVSLRWHVLGAWLAVAVLLVTPTYSDVDLWGHTRFGLDFLRTWSLPRVDPYSFLQGHDWINHEWLSEALMGAAFRLGGGAGLVLLKVTLVATMAAVIARRLRGASPTFVALVLLVAIVMAATVILTVRPHLWSLVGLVVLAAIVDTPAAPSGRRLLAAAGLFAAWANLHGGWVVGGGVLLVWTIARVLRTPAQAPRWVALGATSLAATLANPYGLGLWWFLAATVRGTRPDITEWVSLGGAPVLLWIPVALALLVPLALSLHRDRDVRPPLEAWAAILILVLGSIRVARIASLAAPAVLALLAPRLARAWGQRLALPPMPRAAALIFAVPVALFLGVASWQARADAGCIRLNSSTGPDVEAAGALTGRTGRLWNTFDWGEYAIWHFGPGLRVAIDGRRETVYTEEAMAWTRAAERGDADAITRMADLAPEYVWLPADRVAARAALAARGYRIDVATPRSFVAVRGDQRPVAAPAAAAGACFP